MPVIKTARRSVSPFGLKRAAPSSLSELALEFEPFFGTPPDEKPALSSFSNAVHVPFFIDKISRAAANDAPDLERLCQFLLTHKVDFEIKNLENVLFQSMERLFDLKTELFLIDHIPAVEANPEKGIEPSAAQERVLFAKERDILVGRYFAPITENNPGLFSSFISRWVETENLDRLLHFLDFAAGSKNPTIEHYLLFVHPVLKRIVTNKNLLRSLIKKTEPLLGKLSSTDWAISVRKALDV